MAQKLQIELVDDLDPTMPADETVHFAIDGSAYEIDLNSAHAAELRSILGDYANHGRKHQRRHPMPGMSPTRVRQSARAQRSAELASIREWAKSEGRSVNDRGRVPAELEAAYRAAHA